MAAPSSLALAPDMEERAIDLVHLARTTLGDPILETEMLAGFGVRAATLMLRMQQTAVSSIVIAAQMLSGLARSVGAWRVAVAAETVEIAAETGDEPALRSAIDHLGLVVKETCSNIAEFLRTD